MRILLLLVLLTALALPVVATDTTPTTANLAFVMKSGDATHYGIKINVVGKRKLPGDTQPISIDTTLSLAAVVSAGDATKDGTFPIFISCESASATLAGKNVPLEVDSYPKTTALIDKTGAITRILPSDPVRSKQPGINYRSFIILLNPNASPVPLHPGQTWQKRIAIPSETHKYDMSYKLEGFDKVAGVDTARVRIDIALADSTDTGSTGKGFAVCNYTLDGAKLVSSHSEMNVKMTDPPTTTPSGARPTDSLGDLDALIKVDITRAPEAVPAPAKP